MKLERIWVRKYGPLRQELAFHDGVTVVEGPNESGKSLLVEALTKYCVDVAPPGCRIDGPPEGHLEVTVGDGTTHTLGNGTGLPAFLEDHYNQELAPRELFNIFIIRNGDLGFHEDEAFYSGITDRLTGRRVADIQTVRAALLEAGRLTEARREVSSANRHDSAGEHLETARSLLEDVEAYIDTVEGEGLDGMEARYLEARAHVQELEERQERLGIAEQHAKRRQRYERLSEDLRTIEMHREALADLPDADTLEALDRRLRELSEREGEREAFAARRARHDRYARWALVAGGVALAGGLVAGNPLLGGLAALPLLGVAVYAWYRANRLGARIGERDVRVQRILSDARAAGLTVDDREDVRARIAEVEARRQELQQELRGKQAVLVRELELPDETLEEVLDVAAAALDSLAQEIDEDLAASYDREEAERVANELGRVRQERDELEQAIEDHHARLEAFRDRARRIDFASFTDEPLALELENLDALRRLRDRLAELIEAIERDAAAARTAIDIFEDMRDEEQRETAELFEEGSRASAIFRRITDGRYERISYDTEENELIVAQPRGETFRPAELSEGTRDQLYFAIRVALGEELLTGEPGFFVMDDAFLTADPNRLELLAAVTETLAAEGWQIIYLTAKPDAVETISACTPNEPLSLPPLE